MGITLQKLHAENAEMRKLLETSWQWGGMCVLGRRMGEQLHAPIQFNGGLAGAYAGTALPGHWGDGG